METLDEEMTPNRPADQFLKVHLTVDLWAQIVLFAICLSFLAIQEYETAAGCFYFGVGGYQFVTSMVHLRNRSQWSGIRRAYYPQLIVHACLLIGGIAAFMIPVLFVELFATPLTAIYLLVITIIEYAQVTKK